VTDNVQNTGPIRPVILEVLQYKLRYFLSTCPQTLAHPKEADDPLLFTHQCKFCGSAARHGCSACLQDVLIQCEQLYNRITNDAILTDITSNLDKDVRVDLALVASVSLLKLAGVVPSTSTTPLISRINVARFLQAVILLDSQLRKTPDEISLRLLLIRLYLILGCGTIAHQLWQPLGVKRTILDALSPLLFDRISSISPSLFHFNSGRPLLGDVNMYYSSALRDRASIRIWDAFTSGNYNSILDMAEFNDRLHRSSTRVMAVVEERRAIRSFGGKLSSTDEIALFGA
jgi:N-terminal acetyltransferase B complex non-catalytic subunit